MIHGPLLRQILPALRSVGITIRRSGKKAAVQAVNGGALVAIIIFLACDEWQQTWTA
jgi:hypothetical protein